MPTGDLPGWSSILEQDFSNTATLGSFSNTYSSIGSYPYPWTDTSHNVRSNPGYYHTDKVVSVANGVLNANLHYDSTLGQYLVAALQPQATKNMLYGRFSIRMRADVMPGYKVAPLLWPVSESWPDDGEIDFPEGDLDSAANTLDAFHHYASANGGQASFDTKVKFTEWHTYETAWSPGKVEFFVDGKSIGSTTKLVPNKPMRWVLQLETSISSKAPATNVSGNVQIDWIKAYKYSG